MDVLVDREPGLGVHRASIDPRFPIGRPDEKSGKRPASSKP
jgi:hypothetical protein